MKQYRKLWGLLLCLICFSLMLTSVSADVGNSFSGDDFDFGGGSGSGIDLGLILFLTRSPVGMVILVVLVVLFIASKAKGSSASAQPAFHDTGFKSNSGINESSVISLIQSEDPQFAPEAFKSYVSEVWITLQRAWESKSWQQVRPFESDSLFRLHHSQLQEYIDSGKTNYMKQQNVRSVTLANYQANAAQESVVVKLDASLLDYVKDDATGKLLEGSDSRYVHRSYRLEFVRKAGVKTVENQGINITNCPNCGAPTQITSSGQCEYCDSVITNGDYGWVLNRYTPWN